MSEADKPKEPEPDNPTGSGYFAAGCGLIFAILGVVAASSSADVLKKLPVQWVLGGWLLFIAVCLIAWGVTRVITGTKSAIIGQITINFVVTIAGVTVAILALIIKP